jgi:Protein of unknown function (DUF3667)
MQSTKQICKNCGNSFTGNYCSNCGEKVYTPKDKSVSHILSEGFHFVTHLEGNYLRTLRSILTRPGQYSLDYCNGIRKKYFKPVSLFLIGVIIYLFLPYTRGLNMTFGNNLNTFDFISLTKTAAVKKAATRHISMSELGHRFDTKSPKIAKILLLVILPLTGITLYLLFAKGKKKYFDHFIIGTEISSFFLYFTFILLPVFWLVISLIFWLFGVDPALLDNEWAIVPVYLAAMIVVCTRAFKLFYHVPYLHAFLKSLLFLLFHSIIVLLLYRLILYFVVLLFI